MRRLCGLLPGVVLATVWSVPIPPGAADQGILPFTGLDDELSALRDEVVRLRAENARLERLLELTPQRARPPGPVQTGVFDGEPGPVHAGSPASAKVAFYASLFAARPDVYAVRWENARTGRAGWVPAARRLAQGRSGRGAGVPAADRGGHHRPSVRRAGTGAVSAAGRRPLPLAGRRLRRPRRARCARLPQGSPRSRRIRGSGGVPFRSGRARLVADAAHTDQIADDVLAALSRGRHCLVLTQWTEHLDRLVTALSKRGHEPVVLRGGVGAKSRAAALARLEPRPDAQPLLVVATGPYVGEGFDCPALDTLFLAAPVAFKGRLVQYAGRILRPFPGKTTAEVHDYHDVATGVLASSLAKRAPGYTSLGFPDPRR